MKFLSILFPINLYLSIFQLEGYSVSRFLLWIGKHFFVRRAYEKRKLVFTAKIKILLALSLVQILIVLWIFWILSRNITISIVLALFVSTQFYLLLAVSRIVLYPFDFLSRELSAIKTRNKIESFKNLKIIGITGSYGKTTTKEILYQLIKDKFKTLRTPESYNTIFGIGKVVDYELDGSYKYFICEMAAYRRNEIGKLCQMVRPNYGILTGITSQHLERFGSLENIIQTKFELYDYVQNKDDIVCNLEDVNVTGELSKRRVNRPQGYLKAHNLSFSDQGSKFEVLYKNKKYLIKTNLFGISNVQNLRGAISMALRLGIDINYLIEKAKALIPVQNRFVIRKFGDTTIVDNTFSSNEEAFRQAIATARLLGGKKVLITPGIVELGKDEDRINGLLGKESNNVFDMVVLVGKNNRTKAFSKNYNGALEFIDDTRQDFFEKIEDLRNNYTWIFLENDITQNY